jgi:hypothetical protein
MQPSQYHAPRCIRKNSATLSALVISAVIMAALHGQLYRLLAQQTLVAELRVPPSTVDTEDNPS